MITLPDASVCAGVKMMPETLFLTTGRAEEEEINGNWQILSDVQKATMSEKGMVKIQYIKELQVLLRLWDHGKWLWRQGWSGAGLSQKCHSAVGTNLPEGVNLPGGLHWLPGVSWRLTAPSARASPQLHRAPISDWDSFLVFDLWCCINQE